MEASEKKGWAALSLINIVVLTPYILKLAYAIACIGIIIVSADLFNVSRAELQTLIEAGDLPNCVMAYPMSMSVMIIGAGMLLIGIKRR